MAAFGSRYLSVARPDNHAIPCGLNDLSGDLIGPIEDHDALDLRNEAFQKPKISASYAYDCRLRFDGIEICGVERDTEFPDVSGVWFVLPPIKTRTVTVRTISLPRFPLVQQAALPIVATSRRPAATVPGSLRRSRHKIGPARAAQSAQRP